MGAPRHSYHLPILGAPVPRWIAHARGHFRGVAASVFSPASLIPEAYFTNFQKKNYDTCDNFGIRL
jgi:hypothetical protein